MPSSCFQPHKCHEFLCHNTQPQMLLMLGITTPFQMPRPKPQNAFIHISVKVQWETCWAMIPLTHPSSPTSSQCSVTCERGTQQRVLRCAEKYVSGKYRELASKKCLHLPKPALELERACSLFPCPKHPLYAAASPPRGSWFASPWSQVRC